MLNIINLKLGPCALKFQEAKIRLGDTSAFFKNLADNSENEEVDAKECLASIAGCSWYGPYYLMEEKTHYFVTIKPDGTNSCQLIFELS